MKLLLKRIALKENYTIGNLYIDGEFFCNTLEDKVRGENDQKVYGKTAIPYGTYGIDMTYSPKFGKEMPLLLGVPNFEGVRIHIGNSEKDTEGCILLGINNITGKLTQSTVIFDAFIAKIKDYTDKLTIEII